MKNILNRMPFIGKVGGHNVQSEYQWISIDAGLQIMRPRPFIYSNNELYVSVGNLVSVKSFSRDVYSISNEILTRNCNTMISRSWLRDYICPNQNSNILMFNFSEDCKKFNIQEELLTKNGISLTMEKNIENSSNIYMKDIEETLLKFKECYGNPSAIIFNGFPEEAILSGDMSVLDYWVTDYLVEISEIYDAVVYGFLPARQVKGDIYDPKLLKILESCLPNYDLHLFEFGLNSITGIQAFDLDRENEVYWLVDE